MATYNVKKKNVSPRTVARAAQLRGGRVKKDTVIFPTFTDAIVFAEYLDRREIAYSGPWGNQLEIPLLSGEGNLPRSTTPAGTPVVGSNSPGPDDDPPPDVDHEDDPEDDDEDDTEDNNDDDFQ